MRMESERRSGVTGRVSALALAAASPLLGAAGPGGEFLLTFEDLMMAAIAAGSSIFASVAAVGLLRSRRREREVRERLSAEVAALAGRLARAEALLAHDDQVLVVWGGPGAPTDVAGRIDGAPAETAALLDFAGWLHPEDADELAARVEALRAKGEAFEATVRTTAGAHIEAEGRCSGSSAILRLSDLSSQRAELARIAGRHRTLLRDLDALRAVLAAAPHPAWLIDGKGALTWVNAAYAAAVEKASPHAAVEDGAWFLEAADRMRARMALKAGGRFEERVAVVIAGERRSFDVAVIPAGDGAAGFATDVSEAATTARALDAVVAAQRRTLDAIPTGVAVFGADRRLAYHNPAWRDLWGLSPAFLDERPDEAVVLDRLREARKLPDQADYQGWKARRLAAHRATEPEEELWHLPDQRVVRVHTHPNPQGGLTLVQEDVTQHFGLLRSHEASGRMMRETLDAFGDAVVVFGSDGKLKFSNPAFAALWRLTPSELSERTHIDGVVALCERLHEDPGLWQGLRAAVFAVAEERAPMTQRVHRRDGTIIDVATVPLPDGATLATFVDATAQVNVEKVLTDRNEALENADRIKTDFVKHVSYELRSPLTNIIGFAQLLTDTDVGPLNPKQREYLGYIAGSSSALLAIINDILDLSSVDAGVMELDLALVDVREAVAGAVEGVRDRLSEHDVGLEVDVAPDTGSFLADPRRVRQILFNLISNAIGFSSAGKAVRVFARRDGPTIEFRVEDQGRGIPADQLDRVFDRFETRTAGTRHRGAGLGLSIVRSFVELHGGKVLIQSAQGRGTSVVVRLPDRPVDPLRATEPAVARSA